MDPPPQYASTYGVLHFSNFSVKRALMPDVVLSQKTQNAAMLDMDQKWPEYTFSAELDAKEKWQSYQRMQEAEREAHQLVEAERKEKQRIEAGKIAAAAERARAEAEADELIRSRTALAAAEKAKKEARAAEKLKQEMKAAELAKQLAKENEEKAERKRAISDVCSVTGLNEEEANKLLDKHAGDSSQCIQVFFDDAMAAPPPVTPPPVTPQPSLSLPTVTNPKSLQPSSSSSSISSMSSEDQARHQANLDRIERIRAEDRLLASRMSDLQSRISSSSDPPFGKDRTTAELIKEYCTDDTFNTPLGQAISVEAVATPLQPFTASNPLIATDPFSSLPSPRPAVASVVGASPTGIPPPIYPQPPAYGSVTGNDFPPEHLEKVQQLMALTHASESQCQLLLMCEKFDLDRACDSFFSGSFDGGH